MNWLALLDSTVSAAITILVQSTIILGVALLGAWLLRRNASLRYPVMLSALGITVLAAGWAVWNPSHAGGIVVPYADAAPQLQESTLVPEPSSRRPLSDSATVPIVPTQASAPDSESISTDRSALTAAPAAAVAKAELMPSFPWRGAGVGLLAVWVGGSGILLIRLVQGNLIVRRLLRDASEIPALEAQRIWRSAVGRFGRRDRTNPRVFLSGSVRSPMVVGAFEPRLVLPATMEPDLGKAEFQAILAHEFAHIIRRDNAAGLAERWVQILLWPQPLLGFCLRILDRSREEICDNYALAVSDRQSYGRLLLALADGGRGILSSASPATMGLLQGRWSLEQRISDLLNPNRNTMTKATPHQWIAPTAAIAAIALSLGGTRITLAAPEDDPVDKAEHREDRERAENREREGAERGEAENIEAQIRELRAAMREAADQGQAERAQELEIRIKELHGKRERAGRERDERHQAEAFEARIRELNEAIRKASESGQRDRAHQLELERNEIRANRERQGRERDEHRQAEAFEAQIRELNAAIREASERGEERRAHELELRLKELRAHREREGREREVRSERQDGERFEAQVRELKSAMRAAAERGEERRAHELELRLKELLAHNEGAEGTPGREQHAAQLERRLEEMSRHVEEMQRAMTEMRRELERLRREND